MLSGFFILFYFLLFFYVKYAVKTHTTNLHHPEFTHLSIHINLAESHRVMRMINVHLRTLFDSRVNFILRFRFPPPPPP